MVSEGDQFTSVMSSACSDFTQHAWKKDVCLNCQRPKTEHPEGSTSDLGKSETGSSGSGISGTMSVSTSEIGSNSPKPAKRNSLMTKSWTAHQSDGQEFDGREENEEEQWNAMCLPDPQQPNKRLDDTDQILAKPLSDADKANSKFPEHSYEDIDGKKLKSGQRSSTKSEKSKGKKRNDAAVTVSGNKPTIALNPEERLETLMKNESALPTNKDLNLRSRSTSREKSPILLPKPKISEKPAVNEKAKESVRNLSPRSQKKLKKEKRSISFVEREPSVIGDDGGIDNLISDNEDNENLGDNDPKESIHLSETEKEWALESLKNTIWNGEHINKDSSDKKNVISREFEDLKVDSQYPDKLAYTKESETDLQNFGTFPFRTKSEKSAFDQMFTSNRLSTLSESSENVVSDIEDKYESVLKFIGADKLANFDFNSSPKHKGAITGETEGMENSYDDPWNDKFAFESETEMSLLDEIKGEIDLDASGAGFALVDLLNDVLAKYSTGTPSETDSVKNLNGLDDERSEKGDRRKDAREKSADLEAKMVHLAANLRKHRAKGRAPRPPSCPPEPPQDLTSTPEKQAELRAAQSKEPTFKMVPLGKTIGTTPLEAQEKAFTKAQGGSKSDMGSTSSGNSSDFDSKGKASEKDKGNKKTGGGIGGFFSRIFGGRKDSDSDLTASTDTLTTNILTMSDPYTEVDTASYESEKNGSGDSVKDNKRDSPQMKAKVVPVRPVSPKPSQAQIDAGTSQKQSPNPEVRVKAKDNVKTEKSDKNSSQKSSNVSSTVSSTNSTPSKSLTVPVAIPRTEEKDPSKPTSPKGKEAPPLPQNPPRELTDATGAPKPRARGNSEGGAPRSRPRTRDHPEGKPRDIPNVPPPKPPVAMKPRPVSTTAKSLDNSDRNTPPVTINSTASAINSSTVTGSHKEKLPSTSSVEDSGKLNEGNKKPDRPADPKVLRKRAKSPKRIVAPIAPGRASMPNILTGSNASLASNASEISIQSLPASQVESKHEPQAKGLSFAKELEQKLSKEQHGGNAPEVRKMSAPPAPPIVSKHNSLEKSKSLPNDKQKTSVPEKSKSLPSEANKLLTKDKDLPRSSSPKEVQRSRSSSKDDLKITSSNAEISPRSHAMHPTQSPPPPPIQPLSVTTTATADNDQQAQSNASIQSEEVPIHLEKIELPKQAGNSRKSFLGKLNRNKNKQSGTSSIKRTKSITESAVLGDHHLKRIDVKDISGPVLITDMSSNKVVNRRNTITIGGDDNPFLSGGSTSSGSTSAGEKCELSPRDSVENLYEFIKNEAPTPPVMDKKNLYDHVVENVHVIGLRPPSMTGSEGYLEPVRANQLHQEPVSLSVAETVTSLGSIATNMADKDHKTTSTNEMAHDKPDGIQNAQADISPERRDLLANQPIYEEITNGYGKIESNMSDNKQEENQHGHVYGVNDQSQAINITQLPTSLKKKDSFSSESELSSASNSLSRPRPIPRRRPRPIGSGFEQYVAMNRPGATVFLNEEQLRDMLGQITSMNLGTIREIYTQHEKCFMKENIQLGSVGPLKWHDFDIYGKPIHTSDRSIIYNAKMRTTMSTCQVMLLHSRPEITAANHPSLLKPTCIFTDHVPFSYLTEEFIKTSQILETGASQTLANMAKCYIAVGIFDITESLNYHMGSLETVCENQKDFLRKVLFFVLQLLSAMSHCLEEGHPISECDFHDLYLISNPYCLGETVSFLPQVRSPEDQRIDRVCLFLEKFLQDMCAKCDASAVLDDSAFYTYTGIQKMTDLLEAGVLECLPVVRSYIEFILWGPGENNPEYDDDRQSNIEPKLSMWLEKERAALIHDFAKRVQKGSRCNIRDFYRMKFLLKASAGSLLECIRCHAAATETAN
ncbi:uncharacterized protein LOC128222015 [Mya arenaria]|uniref:uncharacterized protein LOC128222015 n=1 Tax=Mya arenaria TaxID=6604 RepID=UPI0022E023C0|nr:uncharacterized protein LOC128222015 [Mya arenaria]XP_052786717.1 uncharacterized protein LOC128222015 [Mya arenaria]XP_052786718.1 uncharacterized protein LOC128222015 [Mya arenaria]